MYYINDYDSPLGKIMIACSDSGLIGVWFDGQRNFVRGLTDNQPLTEHPIIDEAKRWLEVYFSGQVPDFTPQLHMMGTTFQLGVWDVLRTIPYGQTTTYKSVAESVGCGSAQAVGQAVGRNPIAIIIPCHRVIGSDGGLTGYGGGLWRKEALLRLEGHRQK